jgi:hypothetical protein
MVMCVLGKGDTMHVDWRAGAVDSV